MSKPFITHKDISEIMNEYLPRYPENNKWKDTIEYLTTDPIEKEKIEQLREQLDKFNVFRTPIRLYHDLETGEKTVDDGTHRIVAAYLNDKKSIRAEIIDSEVEYEDDYSANYAYLVRINVISGLHISENGEEDDTDKIFGLTDSLMITDDVWLVSDFGSSYKNTFKIYLIDYDENLPMNRILERIIEKISNHLPELVYDISVGIESWNFFDKNKDD